MSTRGEFWTQLIKNHVDQFVYTNDDITMPWGHTIVEHAHKYDVSRIAKQNSSQKLNTFYHFLPHFLRIIFK